jgi:hypothetical protein
MPRIAIVGIGLAFSALLAWSMAIAQSRTVTPAAAAKTPTKAPTQIAQGTTGITTTLTGTAGTAAIEAGFGVLGEGTVFAIGGAVVGAGAVVQNSSVVEGAAATSTR